MLGTPKLQRHVPRERMEVVESLKLRREQALDRARFSRHLREYHLAQARICAARIRSLTGVDELIDDGASDA